MKIFTVTNLLRTLLPAAVAVAIGAGCGSSNRPSALVGQWIFADGFQHSGIKSVELLSDGTGLIDGVSLTWKAENNRLMLLTSTIGVAADYKVSGYEVVLTYDEGESATFVKKGKLEEYERKKEEEERKEEEREKKEKERAKKEAGLVKNDAEKRFKKISTYFTDSRNGQKYRAVKIGGKTWMAENLNYQTGNSWCYDNDNSNCELYGRLYDWNTATSVCPTGWHLPSDQDWNDLVEVAGGMEIGGKKLKARYGWASYDWCRDDYADGTKRSQIGNGKDEYGFSAISGGLRNSIGTFFFVGRWGRWWTSTGLKSMDVLMSGERSDPAIFWGMYCDGEGLGPSSEQKTRGFSVRCIQDDEEYKKKKKQEEEDRGLADRLFSSDD